jgi:hypothetical protein
MRGIAGLCLEKDICRENVDVMRVPITDSLRKADDHKGYTCFLARGASGIK